MLKTLSNLLKQDQEKYKVPRKVQDIIPIKRIWSDGIFLAGNKYTKSFSFSDINYLGASHDDKESMLGLYGELLSGLEIGSTTKITINNRPINRAAFEESILMPLQGDSRDCYREEYNQMLLDKGASTDCITQEKYITVSVAKPSLKEARDFFTRVGAELTAHFAALGSKCEALDATDRLRILHE